MQLILGIPLTNQRDVNYIWNEYTKKLLSVETQLQLEKSDEQVGNRLVTTYAHIWFNVALCSHEEVLLAYLWSTDIIAAQEVDYQNTKKTLPDWKELLCEVFNYPTIDLITNLVSNLHDWYRKEIICERGTLNSP